MTLRAVYDAMVFYQWAALPAARQHGTVKALYEGKVRLCLSPALISEVRGLLVRPNIRARAPSLTDERVTSVLEAAAKFADWFPDVPAVFTFQRHTKDDHLFNLAIHAKADYLVTFETRLLSLNHLSAPEAKRLRELAPDLRIVRPDVLWKLLKAQKTR